MTVLLVVGSDFAGRTIRDASSSQTTRAWMPSFTVVLVPIVVTYTSWAFWVIRGKVRPEDVEQTSTRTENRRVGILRSALFPVLALILLLFVLVLRHRGA